MREEGRIYWAGKEDLRDLAILAHKLWPDAPVSELKEEFEEMMACPEVALFLCRREGVACAFAQVQLRHDYVEGTESSPVAYLEGIFVESECRQQGIGRALVLACQNWACEQGVHEFASDCLLENQESLQFHLAVGFREANRLICFVKSI